VFLPNYAGVSSKRDQKSVTSAADNEKLQTKNFVTNRRLMLSLADAGGRILYVISISFLII
jgi:hypothetical protein